LTDVRDDPPLESPASWPQLDKQTELSQPAMEKRNVLQTLTLHVQP